MFAHPFIDIMATHSLPTRRYSHILASHAPTHVHIPNNHPFVHIMCTRPSMAQPHILPSRTSTHPSASCTPTHPLAILMHLNTISNATIFNSYKRLQQQQRGLSMPAHHEAIIMYTPTREKSKYAHVTCFIMPADAQMALDPFHPAQKDLCVAHLHHPNAYQNPNHNDAASTHRIRTTCIPSTEHLPPLARHGRPQCLIKCVRVHIDSCAMHRPHAHLRNN